MCKMASTVYALLQKLTQLRGRAIVLRAVLGRCSAVFALSVELLDGVVVRLRTVIDDRSAFNADRTLLTLDRHAHVIDEALVQLAAADGVVGV